MRLKCFYMTQHVSLKASQVSSNWMKYTCTDCTSVSEEYQIYTTVDWRSLLVSIRSPRGIKCIIKKREWINWVLRGTPEIQGNLSFATFYLSHVPFFSQVFFFSSSFFFQFHLKLHFLWAPTRGYRKLSSTSGVPDEPSRASLSLVSSSSSGRVSAVSWDMASLSSSTSSSSRATELRVIKKRKQIWSRFSVTARSNCVVFQLCSKEVVCDWITL